MKSVCLILSVMVLEWADISSADQLMKLRSATEPIRHIDEYDDFGGTGNSVYFTDNAPDLAEQGFADKIKSSCLKGLWFHYNDPNYRYTTEWVFGLGGCLNVIYPGVASSLRYAGSPTSLNGDSFNLYEHWAFEGTEYFNEVDSVNSLSYMDSAASSLVITGVSPWTFYTGTDFTGDSVCVYPDSYHATFGDEQLDFGTYGDMASIGLPEDSIRSAAKGCLSKKIVRGDPLKSQTIENGKPVAVKRSNL